jgi:N6-adenosine-specific RNA methylase IME4
MFDIVYADPPWRQTKGGHRQCRPQQGTALDYGTLSIERITAILRECPSQTLFLWAIDKFLPAAEDIGRDLGFKLHARIIWDKMNGIAPAFTVRFSHEYLLWLYKSPMPKIDPSSRGKHTTVMREKSVRHSQKPDCAYRFIESLYPAASKIELFARTKREGWDCWGDQVDSTVQLDLWGQL